MAAIIAMTQKPAKITHIMGKVNLNYAMLQKYLKTMIGLRLVKRYNEGAKKTPSVCQATEKGLNFLGIYCELLKLIYGEDYLNQDNNLAVACLQYCKEAETTA